MSCVLEMKSRLTVKMIINRIPNTLVSLVVVVFFILCVCVINRLIVAACANVGCFQCLLFGLADRTLLREREWETSKQCAEHVFFRTVWALFRPEGQLSDPDPQRNSWGGACSVCGCGHTVKHAFTYKMYILPLCVQTPRMSQPDFVFVQVHMQKRNMNLFSFPFFKKNAWIVHKSPSFAFVWPVQQGTHGWELQVLLAVEVCFH